MGASITDRLSQKKYFFKNYETKADFVAKGKEDCRATGKRYNGTEINTFSNQDLLQKAMAFFEDMFMKIDMGGAFEKSRLIITDDKRGIFDFGLASKGLYRPQEYYSKELATELPFEFPQKPPGVVPWESVKEDKMKQFWYTSETNQKTYQLFSEQEGTQAGKLVFKTTTKKSYVMFQKKGGKAKMVDLYVPFSAGAGLNETGMLVRIMPMILVAKYLESVQIRTRISMARMYSEGSSYITLTYPIKEYGDDIDFDYLAANCAEPDWFRGDLWSYTAGILQRENKRNFEGAGTPTTSYNEVLEVFNRYKNWYFEDMKKGNQQEIRVDRNLMLAGGIQEPPNNFERNTEAIKVEFFRILDVVDFQFNKPEKSAERIFKRMTAEGKGLAEFKRYVQKTLADAFSYPLEGEYKTDMDRVDVLEEGYDKAMLGLNKYLESR